MTMNDFTDCKSTIEKISEDTEHKVTMSHNKTECFNFDKVKDKYLRNIHFHGSPCSSVDGFFTAQWQKLFYRI